MSYLLHTGIPTYRTHVLYVPQRPSMLPGTPKEFIKLLFTFSACRSRAKKKHGSAASSIDEGRAIEIAEQWGIDPELWDRPWSTLSGGEAQRIALASAVGLNTAEVLLLDGKCSHSTRKNLTLNSFTQIRKSLHLHSTQNRHRELNGTLRTCSMTIPVQQRHSSG